MNHYFLRLTLIAFTVALFSAVALAQSDTGKTVAGPQIDTRTTADETFELNIAERRITETDFEASTSVALGEESASGLRLRIGVSLAADEINVLLRNVRGSVRFRATLAPVLDLINSRRANNPSP